MEWDTAAADIIVKEAGGVVLQAGKITGKGELLEEWKVSNAGGKHLNNRRRSQTQPAPTCLQAERMVTLDLSPG
jgi:3'-phosphoadenosine 5'-phosphosulfate (PAPS) 3'-phosphatase